MCRDVTILGHQVDGTFAEYVKSEKRFIHPKPDDVGFAEAALAEPISGAVHGVGRCNLKIGETVVVLGCGTIGYFLAQNAANSGAKVMVVEPDREKRAAALEVGVERALDPDTDDVQQEIMDATGGMGADCVMEAVGIPETIYQTVELARKGGKILLMGWTGQDSDAFDCTNLTLDEMTVYGTMGFAFDFPVTLDMLQRDKIDAERIITHRFPLEETEQALKTLHEKADGVWKAVVEV
jgi:threonine dehydrogenase-like Zn-dependent dehydrogenase